jgi:hypothetical protein
MAIAAEIDAGDVIRGLAGRRGAVVATHTGPLHVCMIDPGHGYPDIGIVAGIAELGRGYMTWILTGRRGPVVATHAIPSHTGMVIGGIRP